MVLHVFANNEPELFESVKKVAVDILSFCFRRGRACHDNDEKSLLYIIFFFELLVCGAQYSSCSGTHHRFAELLRNREPHTVELLFKRVFSRKARSAVIGQYIYRNMAAENFLPSCIHLSEKVIFGNGDVFHTVSSFLKKIFAKPVRQRLRVTRA